jgi:hypothetical protein
VQKFSPQSGTYLNEADPFDPSWKKNFYGDNYDKLLAIKHKYDPDNVFYGRAAVGADFWSEQKDMKLCKASAVFESALPIGRPNTQVFIAEKDEL